MRNVIETAIGTLHKLDDGGWCISESHTWRPGVFADKYTARVALSFTDEVLQAVQDAVKPNAITASDLGSFLLQFRESAFGA